MEIKDIVSNVAVYGLEESFKRSKYPMSVNIDKCTTEYTKTIEHLGTAKSGSGHDNFLKGIVVQFDLTFTIKAWTEAERYHFFDIVSSQSTMHCISKFDIKQQCVHYVDDRIIAIVQELVDTYNNLDTEHEKEKKEAYLNLLYNVPVGFKLTAGMTTNYQQLKTIYQQRNNHRLPEWVLLCKWMLSLPHSKLITGKDK